MFKTPLLEKYHKCRAILENILVRFPRTFNSNLIEGLDRLAVNSSKSFITDRNIPHLMHILLAQYFLQKGIEAAIKNGNPQIILKTLCIENRLCLLVFLPYTEEDLIITKERLIKSLQSTFVGVTEVESSFWQWIHPEISYLCAYIEMQRLRGKEISKQEIASAKHTLKEQLSTRVPAAFWPFNEEEAYKQIQILQKELSTPEDLPQVTIHFQKFSLHDLEFIVNVARPASELSISFQYASLPSSMRFLWHFARKIPLPFPKEIHCLSVFLPTHHFNTSQTINLLQAREQVAKYLQIAIGPFRDFNGGLLETQKRNFQEIAFTLGNKIPHFSLFASKAFHALQPVEARMTLSLKNIEQLLSSISFLIDHRQDNFTSKDNAVMAFRTGRQNELKAFVDQAKQNRLIYAEFEHAALHYFCVLDKQQRVTELFKKAPAHTEKKNTLRLAFLEGQPPSLSPYLAGADMRCLTISKLLFEGLTRLDIQGVPQPAGAKEISVAECGKKYIFSLRPSHWSNGDSVTALDYLHGWKKTLSRQWHSHRPSLLFIIKNGEKFYKGLCPEQELGITALDATTLQVELEYADPCFLEKTAQPIFFPACGSAQEPQVFNGPYLLHLYNKDTLEMEVNHYYWDAKHLFFQNIQINSNGSTKDVCTKFYNEEIHWLGDPFVPLSVAYARQLEQEGHLYKKKVMRIFLLYLNTQHPLFKSHLVRQAFSLLDRTTMGNAIFPDSYPLYNPVPMETGKLIDENIQQARELLESGLQHLGINKKYLPPLILHYAELTKMHELAEFLQKTWSEIFELEVCIQNEPWNKFRRRLEKKEFQIAGCFENALFNDIGDFLQRFKDKHSLSNYTQWEDVDYQIAVDSIFSCKAEKCYEKAVSILAKQMPYIPLFRQNLLYAKHPRLRGEVFDAGGSVDFRSCFFEE